MFTPEVPTHWYIAGITASIPEDHFRRGMRPLSELPGELRQLRPLGLCQRHPHLHASVPFAEPCSRAERQLC